MGPNTEPFLDKTLNRVNHLAMVSSGHRHHDHEGDHFEGHPWLDPALVASFATRLAEELGRLQPARGAEFQRRAVRVVERINSLKFDAPEFRRNYVVTHNAFEELLSSFSLPEPLVLSRSASISTGAKTLAAVSARVSPGDCLMIEANHTSKMAKQFAEDNGLREVLVDVMGYSYDGNRYSDFMASLVQPFFDCLN